MQNHIYYLFSATKVGFMPELKWDDKIIVQSNAITRFVAKEVGIAGKNSVEAAQCDAIVDFCSEMVAGKYIESVFSKLHSKHICITKLIPHPQLH